MKDGPDRQFALERPEGRLGFGQLDVFLPQFFGTLGLQIGAQQVGSFAQLAASPGALLATPVQSNAFGRFLQATSYRSATCGWRA